MKLELQQLKYGPRMRFIKMNFQRKKRFILTMKGIEDIMSKADAQGNSCRGVLGVGVDL